MIITTQKIHFTVKDINSSETWIETAFLLPNGAVWVIGESTNDWFFDSIEGYEPCGNAAVVSFEVTDEPIYATLQEMRGWVIGSAKEFGKNCVPSKVIDLIKIGTTAFAA